MDPKSRVQLQYQVSRLLTTERKVFLKDLFQKTIIYTAACLTGLFLLRVMAWGFRAEVLDRQYPSPQEWAFWTRMMYREARDVETPNERTGLIDWIEAGLRYLALIDRLEDPSSKEGSGVRPILQDEGDIYVEGVGKAGLDISMKSEPWRRTYHSILMGMARAAENTEGWVNDTTRNFAFPGEYVIGPSNPHPKPVPFGAPPAPLEENCVPAFDSPQKYYMKILTAHGFTSGQRLEAALAYADWLDYQGLSSTAEEMYDWGLDIAMGALPVGVNNVVDIKTGVINSKAKYISSNILLATTSLAYHHARNNNLSAALPIFLSVLRARRQLLESPSPALSRSKANESTWASAYSFVKTLLIVPPFPPPPPTGDPIPVRTPAALCEEAAVMSHIGEILFASSAPESPVKGLANASLPVSASADHSKMEQSGLSWTREAVGLAEDTLSSVNPNDEFARTKCVECLAVGVENWSSMIATMLKQEHLKSASPKQRARNYSFWGSSDKAAEEEGRWEEESKMVNERLKSVRKLILQEEDRKQAENVFTTIMSQSAGSLNWNR